MTSSPRRSHGWRGGTAPDEPLLSAHGLSAGYNDQPAVRDIDLEVRPGEVLLVLGANGAGKSTTLLALAGELGRSPARCSGGARAIDQPLHRRAASGTALVPEERSAVRSLSVADNLKLGGVSIESAIELFPEIEQLLGRSAGLISGGEQQMLTLRRALGRRPQLVLADEVSLGLAPLVVDRLLTALAGGGRPRAWRWSSSSSGPGAPSTSPTTSSCSAADRVELSGPAAELRGSFDRIERAYLTGVQE